MRYLNQLEPDSLIEHFLLHPPLGFNATSLPDGTPIFSTPFDLLTTLDPDLLRTIKKLPFYTWWSQWLKPFTCFVGTTVSEYVLLPKNIQTDTWVNALKKHQGKDFSFVIIKDIPEASPLLDSTSNTASLNLITAAKQKGFILVEGQALAWVPIDFDSIDAYLERLSKSARKNIRRKLKSKTLLDIQIISTGDTFFSDAAVIDEFYQLYLNVFHQSDIHFDKIEPLFFKSLLQCNDKSGIVIVYRAEGKIIGYNICFVVNNQLLDKYVGFLYPNARDFNLYFVSWFVNLEYALNHKLTHYVAGWTDPQVKKSLGAQFTFTQHAVYIRNPLVRTVLKPFRPLFERDHEFSGTQE